jgi:hypothetical protein
VPVEAALGHAEAACEGFDRDGGEAALGKYVQCRLLPVRRREVIVDDIDFKRPGSGMDKAWQEIAASPDVVAAVEVGGRVGIVEMSQRP